MTRVPRRSRSFVLVLAAAIATASANVTFDYQQAAESFISLQNRVYNLAGNMSWPEGPVWTGDSLIMSDTIRNLISEYSPVTKKVTPFLYDSGSVSSFISSATNTPWKEPGSNGMMLDPLNSSNLIICQHNARRVILLYNFRAHRGQSLKDLEAAGFVQVLASEFNGMRLNSPNDLSSDSSGNIFFTDPPYGLQDAYYDGLNSSNHPQKELPFNGVYAVLRNSNGSFRPGAILLAKQTAPNGIAYSENLVGLFVANSDASFPFLYFYNMSDFRSQVVAGSNDISLPGKVFFDYRTLPFKNSNGQGSIPDGLKVHAAGRLVITNSATGLVMISEDSGQFLRMYPQFITGTTVNFIWSSDFIYITAGGTLIGMNLGRESQDYQAALDTMTASSQFDFVMQAPGNVRALAVANNSMIVAAGDAIHFVDLQSNHLEKSISNVTAMSIGLSSEQSEMMVVSPRSVIRMDNPVNSFSQPEFLYTAEGDEIMVDFVVTPSDDLYILTVSSSSNMSTLKFLKSVDEGQGNLVVADLMSFAGIGVGIVASVNFDFLYITVSNTSVPGLQGGLLYSIPVDYYIGSASTPSILASFPSPSNCAGSTLGKVSLHEDSELIFLSGQDVVECGKAHVLVVSPTGGCIGQFELPPLESVFITSSETSGNLVSFIPLVVTKSQVLVGVGSQLFRLLLSNTTSSTSTS